MYCGDGINDLAALAAADIGFAVGATDATIAAVVSTSQSSIAGAAHCLQEIVAPSDMLLWLYEMFTAIGEHMVQLIKSTMGDAFVTRTQIKYAS